MVERALSVPAFGEYRGRTGDPAGMTGKACAQLFGRGCRAHAMIGGAGATIVARETKRLELAVYRAGPKAHGNIPCKVSLPLC